MGPWVPGFMGCVIRVTCFLQQKSVRASMVIIINWPLPFLFKDKCDSLILDCYLTTLDLEYILCQREVTKSMGLVF